jgi:DinB family protein
MDPRLKRLQEEIASVVAGLSAEQLRWHPPGKWCAGEVLEHLYLTYTGTTKGFSRVIEAQKVKVTPPTWNQRVGRLLVVGFGYMPPGRQAPPMARPRGLPTEKVLAEIELKISEMDEMIARCEEKLGLGELLDHPILGPLTGAQWRKFHLVHGLHHVAQVWRLREGGGETDYR